MSDSKVICTHELVVRLEQHDDGSVNWLVQPDTAIETTSHASLEELANSGAPLSALGIRVLWEMLYNNGITDALDKGNLYLWKKCYMELKQQTSAGPQAIEGELGGEAGEGVVIH